jgi:hypothetical protein
MIVGWLSAAGRRCLGNPARLWNWKLLTHIGCALVE